MSGAAPQDSDSTNDQAALLAGHAIVPVELGAVSSDAATEPAAATSALTPKPKESTLYSSRNIAINIYSFIAMGILYAEINWGLRAQGISLPWVIAFLTTGSLANIFFATSNLREYAARRAKKKTCAARALSTALFLGLNMPLSILSCVSLYYAAFSGIQYQFPTLGTESVLLLSLTALPGTLSEAFFTAISAEKIIEEFKKYRALIRHWFRPGTYAPPYKALYQDLIHAIEYIEPNENTLKLETIKALASGEDYKVAYNELSPLAPYPNYLIAVRSAAAIIAPVTSAAYTWNGAELIRQTLVMLLSLCLGYSSEEAPQLNSTLWIVLFNLANCFTFFYGHIYAQVGFRGLFYDLPMRAIVNPGFANALAAILVAGLIACCCGNALSQGLLAAGTTMTALKVVGVVGAAANSSLCNLMNETKGVGIVVAGAITGTCSYIGHATARGCTTVYNVLISARANSIGYSALPSPAEAT